MLVMTLVYEPDLEKKYLESSRVGLQAADNVFQWNMIEGLCSNLSSDSIEICNSVPVGNYPKSNKKVFYSGENKEYRGCRFRNVGFINIPIAKPICRFVSYIRELICVNKDDRRVLTYGLYLPQLLAFYVCNRVFNLGLDIGLIIDDLPAQYGIVHGNAIAKKIKTLIGKLELRILNAHGVISHFVLLTEHMLDAIDLKDRNYTVVEGVARQTVTSNSHNSAEKCKKTIVFYAGTLSSQFGIDLMLEAFSLIRDEEYEFWICGDGDARTLVEEMQLQDERVHYYGFVEKKMADQLMSQASVLINPRPNNAAFTRYSFPSKTIEYLLSGKPVIMFELDGIPKDYARYLHYVPEESAICMAQMIEEICGEKYDQFETLAQQGSAWVKKCKNPAAQMQKVLALYDI